MNIHTGLTLVDKILGVHNVISLKSICCVLYVTITICTIRLHDYYSLQHKYVVRLMFIKGLLRTEPRPTSVAVYPVTFCVFLSCRVATSKQHQQCRFKHFQSNGENPVSLFLHIERHFHGQTCKHFILFAYISR